MRVAPPQESRTLQTQGQALAWLSKSCRHMLQLRLAAAWRAWVLHIHRNKPVLRQAEVEPQEQTDDELVEVRIGTGIGIWDLG